VSLAAEAVPTRLTIPYPGVAVGVVVSATSIFLLGSVPARWAARGVILIGAVLIVRYGSLSSAAGQSASVEAWAWGLATTIALVLSSRLEDDVLARLTSTAERRPRASTARIAIVVAVVIGAISLAFGPAVASSLGPAVRAGAPATSQTRRDSPLAASTSLDMTTRPQLSDAVVMTVHTSDPTFLRDSTYDRWDGRTWHRTETGLTSLGPNGEVQAAPDDLAAKGSTVITQRIRIDAPSSDLVPAAPSAVSIDSRQPLVQWADGDVLSVINPLGRGATYTVQSRAVPATPASLAASHLQPIPRRITQRYASPPTATARVRTLAATITTGVATDYDKVLAIESWLGHHTSYSINAPLAPVGHDVVDDFLFRSKVGWCEQIASSLVVLARLAGVPARLATGFVPGKWDPILRDYQVRQLDAHAWAEVWFPTIGWVPFDPTANVPLAGGAATSPGTSWWTTSWILLALAIGVASLGMILRGSGTLARRVRAIARRRRRPVGWVSMAEARLERWGASCGQPRRPDETVAAYGARLGRWSGEDRLGTVGAVLDEASYGGRPVDENDARVAAALAVLAEVTTSVPASRELASVGGPIS
jgi:transglutaminase-like putative cysteine protease